METDTVYFLLDSTKRSNLPTMIGLLKPHLELRNSRETVLQIALTNEDYEMAMQLIKGGANIHVRDYVGNTPLIIAAYKCQIELTELLINLGADIHDENYHEDTAWGYINSRWVDQPEKSRILRLAFEKNLLLNHDSSKIFDVLALVSEEKLDSVIEHLEYKVIDVDPWGFTPLMWAAIHKSVIIVEKLVKAGAYIDYKYNKSSGRSAHDIIEAEWSVLDKNKLYNSIGYKAKIHPLSQDFKSDLDDEKKAYTIEKEEVIPLEFTK